MSSLKSESGFMACRLRDTSSTLSHQTRVHTHDINGMSISSVDSISIKSRASSHGMELLHCLCRTPGTMHVHQRGSK
jgi:hypothetical protein